MGDHRLWSLTLKATAASLVMAAATNGMMHVLEAATTPGLLGDVLVVSCAGGIGATVYGLLALALKIEEIHLIRAAFVDGLHRLTRAVR